MKDLTVLKKLNRKLKGDLKVEFVSLLNEYRRRLAIEDAETELGYHIQELAELLHGPKQADAGSKVNKRSRTV